MCMDCVVCIIYNLTCYALRAMCYILHVTRRSGLYVFVCCGMLWQAGLGVGAGQYVPEGPRPRARSTWP